MIRLVVFDMAGTTVRDGDAVSGAFRAALAGAGVTAEPEAVAAVMGLAKPAAIRQLLVENRGTAPEVEVAAEVAAIHADFVSRMQHFYAEDPAVGEIPGASETFRRLREAGVRVALNTGFSRPIVLPLLARLGWTVPETVDAVVTSDEVERGRPHPDMIRLLMERFDLTDPAAVAKVGDTWADLEERLRAGYRGHHRDVQRRQAARAPAHAYPRVRGGGVGRRPRLNEELAQGLPCTKRSVSFGFPTF